MDYSQETVVTWRGRRLWLICVLDMFETPHCACPRRSTWRPQYPQISSFSTVSPPADLSAHQLCDNVQSAIVQPVTFFLQCTNAQMHKSHFGLFQERQQSEVTVSKKRQQVRPELARKAILRTWFLFHTLPTYHRSPCPSGHCWSTCAQQRFSSRDHRRRSTHSGHSDTSVQERLMNEDTTRGGLCTSPLDPWPVGKSVSLQNSLVQGLHPS